MTTTTQEYNKTGWFTFFIVITAILPAIGNILNALSSFFGVIGGIFGANSNSSSSFYINGVSTQTDSVASGVFGIVIYGLLSVLFVYFSIWLLKARTALQSASVDNPEKNLITAQYNLLKFVKVSTILELISIIFAGVVIVIALGIVGFVLIATKN